MTPILLTVTQPPIIYSYWLTAESHCYANIEKWFNDATNGVLSIYGSRHHIDDFENHWTNDPVVEVGSLDEAVSILDISGM